jgi:hypothetical protein
MQGGHYYDASIHHECPYCVNQNIGVTMPLDMGRTMPLTPPAGTDNRVPGGASEEGRTVAVIKEDIGIDPVVGWLISVDGQDRGRDYRIRSDNNYIGRAEKMDVCIQGDDTVSRENHAIISYDARDKIFYFSPGDGRSIVRLNDKAIFSTAEIHAYDIVEVGKTKLVFIPLCGDKFDWA